MIWTLWRKFLVHFYATGAISPPRLDPPQAGKKLRHPGHPRTIAGCSRGARRPGQSVQNISSAHRHERGAARAPQGRQLRRGYVVKLALLTQPSHPGDAAEGECEKGAGNSHAQPSCVWGTCQRGVSQPRGVEHQVEPQSRIGACLGGSRHRTVCEGGQDHSSSPLHSLVTSPLRRLGALGNSTDASLSELVERSD